MPRPRPRPESRLTVSTADDAWRTWAESQVAELERDLTARPESRVTSESYVRGMLQRGRFSLARRAAEHFVELDPDHAPARRLLAWAAVVDGDHGRAREMLDAEVEASPRSASAHLEAARAFEIAGDLPRACAHYRSLGELESSVLESTARAGACVSFVLGGTFPSFETKAEGLSGQLRVEVKCADSVGPADCPSPVVVAPDGAVVSPWTPGTGRSSRLLVTLPRVRTGNYWILVTGGRPDARGQVLVSGKSTSTALEFRGGTLDTVGKVEVNFW